MNGAFAPRLIGSGLAIIVTTATTLGAYALNGGSWPSGTIVMHLQLGSGGTLIDGSSSWNTPAEGALANWNDYISRASFRVVRDSTAPIRDGDGVNNVAWADDVYGTAFGSRTLAVTSWWSSGGTRTDGDVLFNRKWSWNSYRGPLRNNLEDLRRVALHEFGHVLGLGHPDEQGQAVSAIMNSAVSNLEQLTADDVAGAQALYGGAAPTALGPPSGLTVAASGNTVSLSWRPPAAGTPSGYFIEAGSVSGSANLANVSTGSTGTTFTASNVGAGIYYVRVRAANGAGVSAPSNEAILVVGGGCSGSPTAPTALVGSASGSTVRLSWNAAGGNPTTYIVEAGSAPGSTNLANSDLNSATPSLTAPGVGRGVYYVRMRGKNSCGVGPASNEIVVIVQ